MKTLRLGVLSYAHVHAPLYIDALKAAPGVELIGLAEERSDFRALAKDAHDVPIFPTVDELLSENLDAVIVASENSEHVRHIEEVVAAGAHVLCEKPMATTATSAGRMVTSAEEAGVDLYVSFPTRHSTSAQEVRDLVRSGATGRVAAIEGVNQGQLPVNRRSWFVEPEKSGGGALIDHTVHLADLYRWILEDEVVEVYAQTNSVVGNGVYPVETSGIVVLTFSQGTVATIDCSWNRPQTYPSWGGLNMNLVCEKGTLTLDAYAERAISFNDASERVKAIDYGKNSYHLLVGEFLKSLRGEHTHVARGVDGLRVAEIVDAAYLSASSGNSVSIE